MLTRFMIGWGRNSLPNRIKAVDKIIKMEVGKLNFPRNTREILKGTAMKEAIAYDIAPNESMDIIFLHGNWRKK